jgi:hypothetical protein
MPEIDLTQFGFPDKKVALEAAVGEPYRVEGGILAFLNEEAHDDYPAIRRSVRNACVLLDSGVIDFTGVEGFIQGVEQFPRCAVWPHNSQRVQSETWAWPAGFSSHGENGNGLEASAVRPVVQDGASCCNR